MKQTFEMKELVNFGPDYDISNWTIVNDVVMGGRSQSDFSLNEEGHAVFSGEVSLENNGGFSSVRHRFGPMEVGAFSRALIRLRGDGRRYQFRVKSNWNDAHSYIQYFPTSGEWETIEIELSTLYPTFRGRRLNMVNYPGRQLAELAFLIGNKRAESFRLELDWIKLKE